MSRFDFKGDRVTRAFIKLGYEDIGGKAHQKMRAKDDPNKMAVYPRNGEVKTSLLKRVLRENEISFEQFLQTYR